MNYEMPEGAREAVEELMQSITLPIDNWMHGATDKSAGFKASAVMCALVTALVKEAMMYDIPAETVLYSVMITLKNNGAFDDHAVH